MATPTATPAVERVAFQYNSPLAAKLTAACQDFLDWAAKTRPKETPVPRASEFRIRSTMNYAIKTFVPALTKIIDTELNLTIKTKCYPDQTIGHGAMVPVFSTILKNDNWDKLKIGQHLFSGLQSHQTTPLLPELLTVPVDVDLTNSRLTEKTNVYFIYLFLFPCSYLGEEIYSGIVPLTAAEQAAIILHEIGHGITILEHIKDLYHRAEQAANSIVYLNETATPPEVETALSQITTAIQTNDTVPVPVEMQTTLAAVQQLAPSTKGFLIGVAALVLIYMVSISKAVASRFFAAGEHGVINANSGKTSDTVVTISNSAYIERIADEFVTRHGLGGAFVTSLVKCYGEGIVGHVRSEVADAIYGNRLTKSIVLSYQILDRFFGAIVDAASNEYDPDWLRIEHMLLNNMVVFKDTTLSPELRQYFLDDTKKMMELVAEHKNSKKTKLYNFFWNTLLRITARSSIVDGFRTANLSSDYDKLQLMTNGLIKNKLAYHAARLQNL